MKNNILSRLLFAAAALALPGALTGCDDDDEYDYDNSDPITISKVFLQDGLSKTVKDREVDFVRHGQMLRIEGKGFNGVNRVYINGHSCYFSPVMVTNANIWVQVSKDCPIGEEAGADKNTIYMTKKCGVTSNRYEIAVRAASPWIDAISPCMPRPGEAVTVEGGGLKGVSKVELPGGLSVTEGIESDNEEGEWFTFNMPEGASEVGALFITCDNGNCYSPAMFSYAGCTAGVILNYDERNSFGAWGWDDGKGSIVNPAEDKDGLTADPLNADNHCLLLTPERLFVGGTGTQLKVGTRLCELYTGGKGEGAPDFVALGAELGAEPTTPIANLAIQFDILCPKPWSSGLLNIHFVNNYSSTWNDPYCAHFIPYLAEDGTVTPWSCSEWTTVTLPAADFHFKSGEEPATLQDVADFCGSVDYPNFGIIFENPDYTLGKAFGTDSETPFTAHPIDKGTLEIYIDNMRLVRIDTPDFNEFGD